MIAHVIMAFVLMGLYFYSTVIVCVVTWNAGISVAVALFVLWGCAGLVSYCVASFSDPGRRVSDLWVYVKPPFDESEERPLDCVKCERIKVLPGLFFVGPLVF